MADSIPKRRIPPIAASTESNESTARIGNSLFGQMPLAKLEMFCRRLGMGLRAGVDLLKLLDTEARQGSSRHREMMTQIGARIRKGESLATAFHNAGSYFPSLFVQLVTAGETSGGLDRIMMHLAKHYEDLRIARRNFLGQIAWPLIQLILAIAVICLVIVFIKPIPDEPWERKEHFDTLGLGLAGASGVAIFLGWIMAIAVLVGACVVAIWKNLFNCHQYFIPLVLPLPILGSVFSNSAMARMSMTLSMLLNSGVDAIRSVQQAFLSTGNYFYIRGMKSALESVQQGQSLACSLAKAKVFSEEFIQGIDVGELSGNETESLEYLATEYARRANSSMTQLTILTSTAIWIGIAMMIIAMIIRMMMQYVNMLNSLMP